MKRDLPTASGHPVNWTAVSALATLLLLPATQTQAVPVAVTSVNISVRTSSTSADAAGNGEGDPVSPVFRQLDGTVGQAPGAPLFLGNAFAEVGRLSAQAAVLTTDPGTYGQVISTAFYSVFDLVFSGPAGAAFVTTDMNTFIDGVLSTTGGADHAAAAVIATIFLLPPGNPTGNFEGCRDIPHNGICAVGGTFRLDLSNIDHALITTPRFTVPTGAPILLEMILQSIGGAAGPGGNGVADFSDTFSLPPTGPVFDLPAGFTANSIEADIQDNRWLGAGPTPPLPEPSTLTLLGSGGAMMAAFVLAEALRKRRRA